MKLHDMISKSLFNYSGKNINKILNYINKQHMVLVELSGAIPYQDCFLWEEPQLHPQVTAQTRLF